MSDNTTLNAGSGGDVIGSDDISGVKYQRIKLICGADGTNDGDISTTHGLPVSNAVIARASAAWTSATSSDTTLAMTVTGYATVILTLRSTSTITAGKISFEASDDNSNWYPVWARIAGSLTSHIADTLAASETESWVISVAGYTNFRVRLNPAITGSGTVNLGMVATSVPDAQTPLPAMQTSTAETLSNVSSSASNVTLISANDARIGLKLVNDSTALLYLKYGATASSTSHSYQIPAGETWEMPIPINKGIIDGIWASANGNARITESTTTG